MPASILVVDDDPDYVHMATLILHTDGYRVSSASDGVSALKAMKEHQPDVLLIDWNMPDMDGITLVRTLKADPGFSDRYAIMVTARSDSHAKVESMEAGADDYLTKPFDKAELLVRVRVGLRTRSLQKALAQEVRILSRAAEQSPASIIITDTQGTIEYVNSKFTQVTGYASGEVIGKNPRILRSGEMKAEEYACMWNTLIAGGDWRGEFHNKKKNGELFWEHESISPIKNEAGDITNFIAVKEDITERRCLEETASRERNLLSTLIDNLPDQIYVKDTSSRFVLANPAVADMFGVGMGQVKSKTDFDFLPKELASQCHADEQKLLREGIPMLGKEEQVVDSRGTMRWVSATKVPLRDSGGKVIGLVGMNRDITERKLAEQALQKSEQRYRFLFENMIEGYAYCKMVFDHDKPVDFILMDVNNTFEALTGLKNVAGKKVSEVIPGIRESNPELLETYGRVASTGKPERFESHVGSLGIWFSIAVYSPEKGHFVAVFDNITERKRTQQELEVKNTVLATQQETSLDAILVVDQDSKIASYNRQFINMWEIPEEIVVAGDDEPVLRMVVGQMQDPKGFLAKVRYLYENPTEKSRDELLTKDGRTIDRYSAPVIGKDGRYHGRVWYFRDITNRKRREEALQTERILLRTLIDNLPDAIYVKDTACRKTVANLTDVRNIGCQSEAEILGKDDFDLFPKDVAEKFFADDQSVIKTGQPVVNREEYMIDGEGKKRWLLTSKLPLRDEKGAVTGLVGIGHDITNRKHTEEELRRSEEQFRLISENVADMITLLDEEGNCLYASRSFASLGHDPDQMIGKSLFTYVHPDDISKVKDEIHKAAESCKTRSMEFRFQQKDGAWRFVESAFSLLINDAGARIVAVARDITDRVRRDEERESLQKQLTRRNLELEHMNIELGQMLADMTQMQGSLVQSEKMASIGQLTAGIAHEINNPLAYVSSNLNRFREYFDDTLAILRQWESLGTALNGSDAHQAQLTAIHEAEQRADLDFITKDFETLMQQTCNGADRIKSIVDRLRGFSHLAGDSNIDANINDALEETLTIVWNELKYKATIKKDYGTLPLVNCNIGEVKQVFVNLLVNAAHAIQGTGEITLHTFQDESHVVVEVSDTGSGIAPGNLKKIFDPFFTTKPVGKGTGLGLWISATIIGKHKGTITVQSEPGHGTTFTIRLPLEQKKQTEST